MNVDPIQLELMRNLFEAAADEMGITLQRVSFSANIKERRDFSCAIFDPAGVLLAQAAHIPVHLGSMGDSVRAVLDRLGALADVDVAIVNDPFAGGTHLPDITLVSPVFHREVLAGYVANRAHHADVGGTSPGSMTLSRHIDEEGIRIEPAFLQKAGVVQEELLQRILKAVRTPDERLGDLDAQLAANRVGNVALTRMIESHGLEVVQMYGRALLDYSQAFLARTIDAIPDGEYRFDDVLDDDGTGYGPIAIRAVVRIAGNRATVDLTGSDNQVAGCVNCPASVARAAVYYCFACLMDEHVPLNGGCFRNIDVITRPGSVLHAQFPAPVVAGNTETSQRVVDVVFGALAKALPDRIPAASCGTMSSVALGHAGAGSREAGGTLSVASDSPWTYYETIGGGSGASPDGNGASAVQCHMTNTLNTPAEAIEMQYPLRIRRFERAPNTGGAGKHKGGDGIIREIEALVPAEGTVITDRRISRPYGLLGGPPGRAGANAINDTPIRGKSKVKLARGDILRIITPGGGGWGANE
jgi:N-methylhydantoinase B